MPDGRFVGKSISMNPELGSVSLEADYLFGRCIPHLDREGRMAGHPAQVKAIACPMRLEINVGLMPDLLRQLAGVGLVRWYEVDGRPVLEFPGFTNHQRGARLDREAASRFPPSTSENALDLGRSKTGPTAEPVGVSEVKSSEVKGSEVTETTSPQNDEPTRMWKSVAAQALRAAGVPEDKIGDSIANFWGPARERESNDDELAGFVAWCGKYKKGKPWNPAAQFNIYNDDCLTSFRNTLGKYRTAEKERPVARRIMEGAA